MRLDKTFGILLAILINCPLIAQVDVREEHNEEKIESLKDFFTQGHIHGHIRNYSMATINEGSLKDYWTNATGGAIKFETANWKGLQFGVKGIFTYQTLSADLNDQDPLVSKGAKWEKELYDVNRPFETKDLDRLEELYIKFTYQNAILTLGKIDINKGPLFLRRDDRMKPFVYRGLWMELIEWKKQSIYGGWINGVSPRGMTEWYPINEAIGILNNGFQYDGSNAEYHEFSDSRGIGVLGYHLSGDKLSIQIWDYYLDRMYNTVWVQADYSGLHTFGGVQYAFQHAHKQQKQLEFEHRYFQPNEKANVLAMQIGVQTEDQMLKFSSAYLYGFGNGRFLFPKELGRENFYVSQPRTWIDGFGDINVYMIRGEFKPNKELWKDLRFDWRLSYVDAPDQDDFVHNKYGGSSFAQSALEACYSFHDVLEGLEMRILYLSRYSSMDDLSPSDIFYNTNLHHLSLMLDINF